MIEMIKNNAFYYFLLKITYSVVSIALIAIGNEVIEYSIWNRIMTILFSVMNNWIFNYFLRMHIHTQSKSNSPCAQTQIV